ncbi:MAG: hypothetical protein COB02_02080 [Candidatus Cloacimonadota bacterium]|nr:MAG: hypothetical protein COB02_02080 [Candidatus Cloacimonadota bacterium]
MKKTNIKRPLKFKILSLSVGILLLSMILTSYYFLDNYNKEIQENLKLSLVVAEETSNKVIELQSKRLVSVLSSIVNSPRFKSAIGVAISDLPTLQDTVQQELKVSGSDWLAVLNDEGEILADAIIKSKIKIPWDKKLKQDVKQSAAVQVHLMDTIPKNLEKHLDEFEVFTDYMHLNGMLLRVVSIPVYDFSDSMLGILLIGQQVDNTMIKELARVTQAKITILSKDTVFASSLDEKEFNNIKKSLIDTSYKLNDYILSKRTLTTADNKKLADFIVLKSLKPFLAKQKEMLKLVVLLFIVVLFIATILSIGFSNRITKPLHILSEAFERVGKGDLSVDVKINSGDEIEEVSNTFNHMVEDLRQKQTMSKFLTGMAMDEVAAISSGKELKYTGEKRVVSILFSDIRSFTSMCETNDPDVIINALNYYFQNLLPIIEEHGGSLDKLIGDCIMAVFIHRDDYNGANASLRASIQMQKKLVEMRPKMKELGYPELFAGFGINTGPTIVGNVGDHKTLSRTVLGDSVNLSARIEALSKQGKESKILFSEFTKDHLTEDFPNNFLMENIVKGKTVPVKIYEISGFLA